MHFFLITISIFFIYFQSLNAEKIEKEIKVISYINGLSLAEATGRIKIVDYLYNINLKANASGIFSLFLEWQQEVETNGIIKNRMFKTYVYESNDKRGKKRGHMKLSFLNILPEILSANPDPSNDDRRKIIDQKILLQSIDPVAGIINLGKNSDCNQNSKIFDGKRRYDLIIKFVGEEEIEIKEFNKKKIKAIKCEFEIKKLAGYTKKEIAKYPSKGFIWFSSSNNDNLFLPVKVLIRTTWGKFICYFEERSIL